MSKSNFSAGKPFKQKIEGTYTTHTFSLSKEQRQLLKDYSDLTGKSISFVICEEINFTKLKNQIGDLKK